MALLRERSRPYLFSNTVAPAVVAASLKALDLVASSGELRARLWSNTERFRRGLTELGFTVAAGSHPIIPIMLGDARLGVEMADRLLQEGVYVVGFSYPVVPQGKARIRVQMSAALLPEDLEWALERFSKVGKEIGVLP